LADKLRGQPLEVAVTIWRTQVVKGGIAAAAASTSKYHQESKYKALLQQDPNHPEAKEYFAKQERQKNVQSQYQQMMQEYPEAMGRVLMLYINVTINHHPIQAFCDSGAQMTIMSKKVARECDLYDCIDTRFAGTAVGVGTGKIIGRIHIVQLCIGTTHYFPCSVTVMDDPPPGASEMPFLLGLDMMKRHTCIMDLGAGVLKFRLSPTEYLETPFLHEKDLDESKGGTKGFDVQKANERIRQQLEQEEAEQNGIKNDDDDDDDGKPKAMEE